VGFPGAVVAVGLCGAVGGQARAWCGVVRGGFGPVLLSGPLFPGSTRRAVGAWIRTVSSLGGECHMTTMAPHEDGHQKGAHGQAEDQDDDVLGRVVTGGNASDAVGGGGDGKGEGG
jgi:hypothetical protein